MDYPKVRKNYLKMKALRKKARYENMKGIKKLKGIFIAVFMLLCAGVFWFLTFYADFNSVIEFIGMILISSFLLGIAIFLLWANIKIIIMVKKTNDQNKSAVNKMKED